MKVTIVGSWSHKSEEHEAWKLKITDQSTRSTFIDACQLIGKRLAEKRHIIVVGSDSDNSADYYVVQGYLADLEDREAPDPLIHLIQGIRSEGDLYSRERTLKKYQKLFQGISSHFQGENPRAAEKILAVKDADALIAIGGLNDTYVAGIAALVARNVSAFDGGRVALEARLQSADRLPDLGVRGHHEKSAPGTGSCGSRERGREICVVLRSTRRSGG